MNKQELLQELSAKIKSGEISREEMVDSLRNSVANNSAPKSPPLAPVSSPPPATPSVFSTNIRFSISKILYVLGAIIIAVGLISLIAQIWNDIGSLGRILVTLGSGLAFAFAGSTLLKQKSEDNIGAVFHFLGGVIIPGGSLVTLSELIDLPAITSPWPFTAVFGLVFTFYLLLALHHRHPVLTFFSFINGTIFIYLLTSSLLDGSPYLSGDLYAYLTMAIGVSYLLFSHSFQNTWNKALVTLLNLAGSILFFAAAFSQVFDSVFWQGLFFILVVGGLFLSAAIKSRSILIVSSLFIIAHIFFITGKYFADSVGWPLSLLFIGFAIIALGFLSISINKKYIQ